MPSQPTIFPSPLYIIIECRNPYGRLSRGVKLKHLDLPERVSHSMKVYCSDFEICDSLTDVTFKIDRVKNNFAASYSKELIFLQKSSLFSCCNKAHISGLCHTTNIISVFSN